MEEFTTHRVHVGGSLDEAAQGWMLWFDPGPSPHDTPGLAPRHAKLTN